MPIKPNVSYNTVDAVTDTTFVKTMIVVGQSNDATAGLYKDIELYNDKLINSTFGADSHIAAQLRAIRTNFANSIQKPKLWVISYADNASAVARILEATVAGTSTEAKTMKIKINSMNPDVVNAFMVSELALRNTKGAYCGTGTKNGIEIGSPRNANMPFNPNLTNLLTDDVIVEVEVTSGMSAADAAAAINTAINASTESVYNSSVASAVCTLTSVHKGAISQGFTVEFTNIADGLSVSIVEDTAGSDVVDATGILSITDESGDPLSELDFNFICLPYGYSVAALITDAKAKWDNVLEYNNRCLDYLVFRTTNLDLSSVSALNSLASAEPIAENGIVKAMSILKTDGFKIKGVSDYTYTSLIEAKQFIAVLKEQNGGVSVGDAYTLSDSIGFINLERVLTASLVREVIVEKFIAADFPERNYTFGTAANSYTYSKDQVIARFKYYRDILDGTIVNSEYGTDYAGILDNNEEARARFDELLELSVSFDKVTKQLAVKLANELTNPIKSILITSYFS